MFKIMAGFKLREGVNPEEYFKYHTTTHAEEMKKAAGPVWKKLKKFSINRVTRVAEGDMDVYGVIEQCWESEDALKEYFEVSKDYKSSATGKPPMEDFLTFAEPQWALEMVEHEIDIDNI